MGLALLMCVLAACHLVAALRQQHPLVVHYHLEGDITSLCLRKTAVIRLSTTERDQISGAVRNQRTIVKTHP